MKTTRAERLLTHTRLAQGHDGEDPPFLLGGKHVRRMLHGVCLIKDQRASGADRWVAPCWGHFESPRARLLLRRRHYARVTFCP